VDLQPQKLIKIRGIRLILEISLFVFVFFAIKTWMQRDLAEGAAPLVQGKLLDGQPINLQTLKGKTVLLYFWATWCPVCKLQNRTVAAISEDYYVITVAMNSGADMEVKAFIEEKNLGFPVLVDNEGAIASRFGVTGVPTSFIIGPDGDITFTEVGYTTEWGLRFRLWLTEL
jgi:peroxiredoxin